MSKILTSTPVGTIKRLDESTRDYMALGIWLVVLIGAFFLTAHGQSKLVTAGLFFQLTGAYSTFLFCGKPKYRPLVHGVPYAFALTGATLLCLAPNFGGAVEASLLFLAVIALMHGSVIHGIRKDPPETDLVGAAP